MDLHLPFGFILTAPPKVFVLGIPVATLGSITWPPNMVPVSPFPCGPCPPCVCCVPNISFPASKTYIMGMPVTRMGDISVPCGTSPALATQTIFNTL